MDTLVKFYDFIDLAQKNRKYPPNTAHGKRAAVKLFDTVVTVDERQSLKLLEERMDEIYLSLISKYKDSFSLKSLHTYKGRFLKVIQDYKRYGKEPEAMVRWEAKHRKYTVRNIKDTSKDEHIHNLSFPIHTGVHKLEISAENGGTLRIELPTNSTSGDITRLKNILDGLGKRT